MKNLLLAASVFVMTFLNVSAAQADHCGIGFDVNLDLFDDQARRMFAVPTRYVPPGLQYCQQPWPLTDTGKCWMYRQYCQYAKTVTVFNMFSPHYLLDFEDPTITCVMPGILGGYGRRASPGAPCVAANWVQEPRKLVTWVGETWLEIAQKDLSAEGGARYTVFRLKTLDVNGGSPIQIWYKRPDGSVWGWPSLEPNVYYEFQVDATAVWIASTNQASFTIPFFDIETY